MIEGLERHINSVHGEENCYMKSSVSPVSEVKVTYKKRKKKQIISKFQPRKKIKTEKSASHSCFICSDRFDQESKLKSHILSEHEGKGPYKCLKCEREFSRISSLKNHITNLHNENTTDENTDNSGENSDNSLRDSDNSEEDSDHSQENSDDSEEDSNYDSEENFDKNDCYAAIKILQKHVTSEEKVHEGKKLGRKPKHYQGYRDRYEIIDHGQTKTFMCFFFIDLHSPG